MKRVCISLVIAALVVAAPIAINFGMDAKQLRHDLAAQNDTLTTVRTELASANDTLVVRDEQLSALNERLDSLAQEYKQATSQNHQLSVSIARLTARTDSLAAVSGELKDQLTQQLVTVTHTTSQLSDTLRSLVVTRHRLDSTVTLLTERTTFIVQVEPWYLKWKHDATERNWLEKLFGSDKAKIPAFPEPPFPELPRSLLDSLTADTTARLQAQR
jgi:hypothetical protein